MTIDLAGAAVSLPLLALLGLIVGVVAGMFGIGGGFMLTPLLPILFPIPSAIAIGSALCQQVGVATVALMRHRGHGIGEPRVDLVMLGSCLLGADAGTRALAWLDHLGARRATLALDGAYALLLLTAALFTLRGSFQAKIIDDSPDPERPPPLARPRIPPYVALPAVGLPSVSAPVLAYLGFGVGALSGMLGVGGGVALLPILIHGLGFPIRHAAGTGIVLLLAAVSFGTFEHALAGHVDLRIAFALLAGSSLGAQVGTRLTATLPVRALRFAFGALLLGTVAAVVVHLVYSL